MTHFKLLILAVGLLAVVASNAGCKTLALTGHEKYRVTLSNHLLVIRKQIEEEGIVSPKTLGKFEAFLARYDADYANKGSHIRAREALAELQLADSEPEEKRYGHNMVAKQILSMCQNMLTTEKN